MSIARRTQIVLVSLPVLAALAQAACSATSQPNTFGDDTGGTTSGGGGGTDILGGGGNGGGGIGTDGGTSGGNSGRIPQTCAEAIANKSYIGCEYWPTVTTNSSLYPGFPFAVAVANPTTSPAHGKVSRGAAVVSEVDVAPGALQVVQLPLVDELKGPYGSSDGSQLASALVQGGAYHVESTAPMRRSPSVM